MYIAEICAAVAALVSILTLFRSIYDKRFDDLKRDNKELHAETKVELQFIKSDIVEIRERLAFIEASTIFLQVEPPLSKRSEAAKKMWERRNKTIERKE